MNTRKVVKVINRVGDRAEVTVQGPQDIHPLTRHVKIKGDTAHYMPVPRMVQLEGQNKKVYLPSGTKPEVYAMPGA